MRVRASQDDVRTVMGVSLLALLLAAMDGTVVNTILPTMLKELGEGDASPWLISAFILASTVGGPVFGRLADGSGLKVAFLWAVAVFAAGSTCVASAGSLETAIAARTLQGLGAGGIPTLSYTVVAVLSSPEERPKRQGLVSGIWGIAALLGPLAGAVAAMTVGWRWVFLVNLPIAALILAFVKKHFPAKTSPAPSTSLDPVALSLLSAAVTAVLVALSGLSGAVSSRAALGCFAGGAVFAMAFGARVAAARRKHLVEPGSAVLRPAFGANLAAAAVLYGTITFVPQLLQNGMSQSVAVASSAVLLGSLGWVIGALVAGRSLVRWGYRTVSVLGAAAMTLACAIIALGAREKMSGVVIAAQLVLGSGMGALGNATLIAVQNHGSSRTLGSRTALIQLARSLGAAVGVNGLSIAAAGLLGHGSPAGAADPAAILEAYSTVLFGLAGLGLVAGVVSARLPRRFAAAPPAPSAGVEDGAMLSGASI